VGILYRRYRQRCFRLSYPACIGNVLAVRTHGIVEIKMLDKSVAAVSVTLLTLIGVAVYQFYTLAWAVRL
jgi:hypothetical protein